MCSNNFSFKEISESRMFFLAWYRETVARISKHLSQISKDESLRAIFLPPVAYVNSALPVKIARLPVARRSGTFSFSRHERSEDLELSNHVSSIFRVSPGVPGVVQSEYCSFYRRRHIPSNVTFVRFHEFHLKLKCLTNYQTNDWLSKPTRDPSKA